MIWRLLRGELLKMRTTRTFFGLVLGGMVFSGLAVAAVVQSSRRVGAATGLTPRVFASLGVNAFIFAAALGVLTMAGESRHHTADHTFLACPRRSLVFVAKAAAVFIGGVVIGIMAEATIFAIGLPWLATLDIRFTFAGSTWVNVVTQLAAIGTVGVLGLGVAGVVRNQVAALIFTIGWLTIGEGLLGSIFDNVGRYLTTRLLSSVVGAAEGVPRWWAAALLGSYVIALCGVACFLLERRDVA